MKTLTCDVCKNTIESPVSGRNYYHLAHRDICEFCHDKLEAIVKPVVRTKQPFSYEWYARLVQETVERGVAKGKL
ncbi:MAG: hypothetical protein LBF78_04030 [Treponema sp.]|jgi:ribonucleotide reductase alpha subunit|nr:hypothetical protein [Treponema sp.]